MRSGGDIDLREFAEMVLQMRVAQIRLHNSPGRTAERAKAKEAAEQAEAAVDARLRRLGHDVPKEK